MNVANETIEAIARRFYKETVDYGFTQVDYLRFVNQLLDMAMESPATSSGPKARNLVLKSPVPLLLPLEGSRIKIRAFEGSRDRKMVNQWLRDEHARDFIHSSGVSSESADIDHLAGTEENVLAVVTLPDATPIGLLAFLGCDRLQRKAELRKIIGEPDFRGKGFAKEATALWIKYGVTTLSLRKICLHTLDTNFRNIRLNEDLGFNVEGILRSECFFDGEYHDVLRMALISEDM
jgi:RimJ/RimL family protein N-acetyltransferase